MCWLMMPSGKFHSGAGASVTDQVHPIAIEISVNLPTHGFDIQRDVQKIDDRLSGGSGFAQNAVVLHPQSYRIASCGEPLVDLEQMALEGRGDCAGIAARLICSATV